jgi:hypothetical protein
MKLTEIKSTGYDVYAPDSREGLTGPLTKLSPGEVLPHDDGEEYSFMEVTSDGKKLVMKQGEVQRKMLPGGFGAVILPKGVKPKQVSEATSATTSTAKTYKLKKYAGAGLGMWIKDAEADGFKVKKISGDDDKDNDVWNAFDGNRKVGSFSDEERSGWLQAKL